MAAARAAVTGKTRGEARLLEACAEGGCAVCRCLGEDSARHLTTLLHEHVTDPEVRNTLRASRGLCNWHSGMLQTLPGAAFGTAILAADLLARERARAEAQGRRSGSRSSLTAVRKWLRRPAPPTTPSHSPRRCLVCDGAEAAERRYLEGLLALVEDARFEDAFTRGDGLCVPHLARLMDLEPGPARAAALDRLVVLATERWRRLEAALERFVAKHDYRARAPFTEEEGRAWRLGLEMLAGAPGVFGNARATRVDGAPAAGGISGARAARSRIRRSGSRSPGSA